MDNTVALLFYAREAPELLLTVAVCRDAASPLLPLWSERPGIRDIHPATFRCKVTFPLQLCLRIYTAGVSSVPTFIATFPFMTVIRLICTGIVQSMLGNTSTV